MASFRSRHHSNYKFQQLIGWNDRVDYNQLIFHIDEDDGSWVG